MSDAKGFLHGLEASLSTFPQLVTLAASSAVAAVALGFALKLARDFVADKRRQAASLRIVAVYIALAREGWDDPGFVDDKDSPDGRSIASLPSAIGKIRDPSPDSDGREPYTSFVPFSPHDDLTVAEVRDFLGFLDRHTIECVVKFIQAEATTHALAADFRSAYVRSQFDPERKISLLRMFSGKVVEAYDYAGKALDALGPYTACPLLFWCLPFGYRLWRFGVWLWKEEERRTTGSRCGRDSDDRQGAGAQSAHSGASR